MTDKEREEDSEWLRNAFDRALRGDNGVAPDAARPAANPFGVTSPAADSEDSDDADEAVSHNELDLDFETESTVPATAFLPIVDFGDDDSGDDESEPDPLAVFAAVDNTGRDDEPTRVIQPIEQEPIAYVEESPTEALDIVDAPTVVAPTVESTPTGSLDAIESLFGEDKFAEATTAIIAAPVPTETRRPLRFPRREREPRTTVQTQSVSSPEGVRESKSSSSNIVTYGIAGGLIVLLGIGGFIGGSAIGGTSTKPTPTATAVAKPNAIHKPGTAAWNTLFGGECIDPFPGAWSEKFTVVDCADPHAAQLVYSGDLSTETGGVYPGTDSVASVVMEKCTVKGVLDLAAAGAYPNMRVSAAYSPTQKQWDAGNTSFYCFVSLADAAPMTGSVAGTGPTPAPTP